MKNIFIAMVAASMISIPAMAQDNNTERAREVRSSGQAKRLTPSEMMARRTQMTVKRYGLDSEQEKKLSELNNKYKDIMQPMRMQDGQREERARQMEAYDAELKGIMNAEQYKKYSEDRKTRMSQRRGGIRQDKGGSAVRGKKRDVQAVKEADAGIQKKAEASE